jgi:hypothetical protein
VPVSNVSLVDLTFTSSRDTTVEEVNELITTAAKGKLAAYWPSTPCRWYRVTSCTTRLPACLIPR